MRGVLEAWRVARALRLGGARRSATNVQAVRECPGGEVAPSAREERRDDRLQLVEGERLQQVSVAARFERGFPHPVGVESCDRYDGHVAALVLKMPDALGGGEAVH